MSYRLRFTLEAKADLERLYTFAANDDPLSAQRAFDAIDRAWGGLEEFPFSFRRVAGASPFLRELIIPFGGTGYVALFEIDSDENVTVLAVRHQREDDYH